MTYWNIVSYSHQKTGFDISCKLSPLEKIENFTQHDMHKVLLPTWLSLIAEFLPAKNRGCFMVTVTFCGALGAVLAAGLAWWLLPTYGWRVFVAACSVPSYLILVYRCFVRYESPRSLFIRGKREEAKEVLKAIACHNKTVLPKGIVDKFSLSRPEK